MEQERKKKEEERIKAAEEEQKRKHKMFMDHLDKFLSGDSVEPPPELKVVRETRPEAENCPFFTKTSCCRFGDQCSRNHQYPGISRVLISFYKIYCDICLSQMISFDHHSCHRLLSTSNKNILCNVI